MTLLVVMALFLAACAPLGMEMPASDDAMADTSTAEEGSAEGTEGDESMAESSEMEMMDGDGAMATVAARSLRVRQSPDGEAEVVYGVKEGENYKVLSISDDGQWVQLSIADAPEGQGWVSANFVSVNGALTGGEDEMAAESSEVILQPTPAPAEESSEAMADDAMGEEAMAEEEIVAPEAGYALVNTDGIRLRVRAEANTESEIAGYIYDGETYMVIEVNDDGTWVKIAGDTAEVTDNPSGGWVAAEFLVLGE